MDGFEAPVRGSGRQDATGRLRLLLRVAETLDSEAKFEDLLHRALAVVAEALDASAASLCVPESHEDGGELRVSFVHRGDGMETALLRAELGLRDVVLEHGRPLRVDDVLEEPDYRGTLENAFDVEPRALLAVPMQRKRRVIGLLVATRDRPRPFTEEDQHLLEAVSDQFAAAVQTDTLMRQLRLELQERELLLKVSRKVGRSLDLDRVLEEIFDALGSVVPFDAAAIFLVDERDGSLSVGAHRGYDGAEGRISHLAEGEGIVGVALEELRGMTIDRVRDHPRYVEARASTQSEMAVPIVSAGRAVGVINLESDVEGFYEERDLRVAELVAGHVASALVNARLHRREIRDMQVQHELEVAREIQLGLLPGRRLKLDQVAIDATNVPSSTVGGDYYDFVRIDERHLALVIADVSGHGLSAALLMASMRTGVHMLLDRPREPDEIASRLNRLLYEASPANQYVTAVIALLDVETGDMRFCNAGHLPPLVVGPARQQSLYGGGRPLGMFADTTYVTHALRLARGETVVFLTDGLTELRDGDGCELGREPIAATVREHLDAPLRQVTTAVRSTARAHRDRSVGPEDDITLMLVRWSPPGVPV